LIQATDNRQYSEKFSLSSNTVKRWANRIKNQYNVDLQDRFPGNHIDAVNKRVPGENQVEWLAKAKDLKWSKEYLDHKAKEEFNPTPVLTFDEKIDRQRRALMTTLEKVYIKANRK
jgi:hypothetical protein